jgi:putative hydrolase
MKRLKAPIIFDARELDFSNIPKIDAHLHTSWTDGYSTVQEVYERAVEKDLSAILFSEHSRKTSTDWFGDFAREVRSLPQSKCCSYVGTEVKIETIYGDIDTNDEIASYCDFIMASVHRFPSANGDPVPFHDVDANDAIKREFELSMAALENPRVDILGHMFGMSYKRFGVIPDKSLIHEIISLASSKSVAIEINSQYHPNPSELLQFCAEFSALVTFGSNAHKLGEVGLISEKFNVKHFR